MAFTLDNVIPWGRSFDEYVRMFDLSEADLHSKILGCGDGPASFNSQMKKRGYPVVSIDPLYQFSAQQIKNRIEATYDQVMEQLRQNTDDFVWEMISSPEELGQIRMSAMQEFLADAEQGKQEGRYRSEELPCLSFQNEEFDLTVCSHFLFLYSDHLSLEFHHDAITEMCRVAQEVRIFPLLTLKGEQSRYLDAIVTDFMNAGYTVETKQVAYEFQRGGNKLLRIRE